MIVVGGIGSVGGAVLGGVFVTLLPLVLGHYGDLLPFLAQPGSSGISAADLSRILYGLAIVLVLLFAHDGLAGLGRSVSRGLTRPSRRPLDPPAADRAAPDAGREPTPTKELAP
jgi:branched-chain amino acid transport system permease protein